jgi:hypothetical protein
MKKVRVEYLSIENMTLREISSLIYDLKAKVAQYKEEIDMLKKRELEYLKHIPKGTLIK